MEIKSLYINALWRRKCCWYQISEYWLLVI